MKDKIISICKKIEKEQMVKILFAVESGSRLWRMSSKDSDYDIRFVFVQPVGNYLSIKNEAATNLVINRTFEQGLIDISGFDIFKFCKLLLKSNPSVIEWLQSDILYYGKKPTELEAIALTEFNPTALYHHYKSMCQYNYKKYLASKQEVTYKKYLYAMRGLVNAKYVQKTRELPPIHFPEGLQKSKNIIPPKIIRELQETITLKMEGNEKEIIKNNQLYDDYIELFLKQEDENVPILTIDEEKINKALQKLVLRR